MERTSLVDAASSGGTAVLVRPPRPRRAHGAPPPRPPDDEEGGGGGGGGGPGGGGGSGSDGLGTFALVLALLGITTLFAVLIAVWLLLRRPAADWRGLRPGTVLDALWVGSACLLFSSFAVEGAARRARAGRRATRGLTASALLGAGFVAAQAWLWSALWRAGLVPSSSGYAAVFFALTGLHALHVLGGLGFLSALALRSARAAAPPRAASVRHGAIYWHYMGALWLVLFLLLYFVR